MYVYENVHGGAVMQTPDSDNTDEATSTLENGKVAMPRRRKNVDVRTREHLTPSEVEKLLAAARKTARYGDRNEALVLLAYRHGLRVSEVVALKWDQFDLKARLFHVRRSKRGTPSTHPLQGDELRAVRKVIRSQQDAGCESPFVFTSERGGPMTDSNVRKLHTALAK
jgi:type 1 fimbriae regulatory protein FimB/type 1 fimbriae regulatory protein FimE